MWIIVAVILQFAITFTSGMFYEKDKRFSIEQALLLVVFVVVSGIYPEDISLITEASLSLTAIVVGLVSGHIYGASLAKQKRE